MRDVFCFSCATGLPYSDLAQLKWDTYATHDSYQNRAKRGIPLSPVSAAVLEKYKDRLHPLPVISNQKTNEYLKDLGKLAGIDTPIEMVREYGKKVEKDLFAKYELISIHTGRKSFITISLARGMKVQVAMSLPGHTSYKSFKRYVEVTDQQKKVEMGQTWGEVPASILKAV